MSLADHDFLDHASLFADDSFFVDLGHFDDAVLHARHVLSGHLSVDGAPIHPDLPVAQRHAHPRFLFLGHAIDRLGARDVMRNRVNTYV